MQNQSRRWITITILGITSLVFVGLSMMPLVSGLLQQHQENTTRSSSAPGSSASDSIENLKKEEEGYQLVLKREPNNSEVLKGLIETRLKLIQQNVRQPKDVVEPLQQLVQLNPGQTTYTLLLAQAQEQSGNLMGAAQHYRTVLDQQPTNTVALQRYIPLLLTQNQSAAALDLVQKSIATAKQMNQQQAASADLPAIELLLGDVYLSQQKDAEAIALYDRLRKENPNDFRPVVAKGIVLKQQNKTEEALTLFKAAQEMAPAQFKDKIQQLMTSSQPGTTASDSPTVAPTAPTNPTP